VAPMRGGVPAPWLLMLKLQRSRASTRENGGQVMASTQPEMYEFDLQVMETGLSSDEVRQRLQQALTEAIDAAARDEVAVEEANAEIMGAFGGEIALVFFLVKAFAGGAAGAAGKHFYEKYLKPRLEDRKLYPSNLKSRSIGPRKS
jgi:hypothetical protein